MRDRLPMHGPRSAADDAPVGPPIETASSVGNGLGLTAMEANFAQRVRRQITRRWESSRRTRIPFLSLRLAAIGYAFFAGLRTLSEYDLGWQPGAGLFSIFKSHRRTFSPILCREHPRSIQSAPVFFFTASILSVWYGGRDGKEAAGEVRGLALSREFVRPCATRRGLATGERAGRRSKAQAATVSTPRSGTGLRQSDRRQPDNAWARNGRLSSIR